MKVSRTPVPAAAIAAHVDRIVGSPHFAASERLQAFLRFVVNETLEGRADHIKEHTIAVAVYRRPSSFDPKVDSIVRSEARRLRARLQAYYETEGAADQLRIDLPLGRYVPRFVAVDMPDGGGASDVPDASAGVTRPGKPRRPAVLWPARYWLLAGALAVVVLGAAVGLLRRQPAGTTPSRHVTVLIVPFDHDAGVTLPHGAIESGIEFSLARSRIVQAVPRVRVNDALRLMRIDPATRLTTELASEVAARDTGIDVVLTGSVTRAREGLRVSAWLRDAETGRALAAISRPLATSEDGFATASSLASWLRLSVRDVEARRQQLEPAATRSLAALRAYSRGLEQLDEDQWATAETLFRDAVTDDPDFASAHIYHAWTLRAVGRSSAEVLAAARRAEILAAHASERERLFIRASVRQLEGRHAEALQLYEALVQAYPDHLWALRNLTGAAFALQASQANGYWIRYADLRPNDADLALETAIRLLHSGGTRAQADKYLTRARSLNVDADTACVIDHLAAFQPWVAGDTGPWLKAAQCARVTPARGRHVIPLSLLLLSAGRPAAAGEGLLRNGDAVGASRWSAIAAAAAGDRAALQKHARDLAGTRPNALSTILQIWAGQREAASRSFASQSLSLVPGASPIHIEAYWQVARAELQRAKGDPPSRWSDNIRQAMIVLSGLSNPEYFIAAYRVAEEAERRGDIPEARRVLEVAVSKRAEAYQTAIVFWLGCLDRLVRLERRAGSPERAARLSEMLRDTLAVAEPGFDPGALFEIAAQSR